MPKRRYALKYFDPFSITVTRLVILDGGSEQKTIYAFRDRVSDTDMVFKAFDYIDSRRQISFFSK